MATTGVEFDRLDMVLDGRRYGTDASSHERFLQTLPEEFLQIGLTLRSRSQLLDMIIVENKDTVFKAYAHDLALLQQFLQEFQAWVKSGIFATIVAKTRNQNESEEKAQELWRTIEEEFPQVENVVLMDVPASRAAKDTPILLEELKQEFSFGVERVLRLIVLWLDELVHNDLVGLVEWCGLDVGYYHYFQHEYNEKLLDEQKSSKTRSDAQGRIERVETHRKTLRIRTAKARHVHHIVRGKSWALDEYPQKVPERIAAFLDKTPEWLVPLVHIVEGQITMEEIGTLRSETGIMERTREAVYKYSPGVHIAHFNFVGWSASDLAGETTRHYRYQPMYRPQKKRKRVPDDLYLLFGLVGVLALFGFALFGVAKAIEGIILLFQ